MSGCELCEKGKYCIRDELGWESFMGLEFARDDEHDEPYWFIRLLFHDKRDNTLAAENYPVNYCPVCGRKLEER
jgi:hypothetical protein